MVRRLEKVNVLLREAISEVVTGELSDPRMASLVSVTEVDCSSDLRRAKVFVSVLGSNEEKISSLEALKSASGFVNHRLKSTVTLRSIPQLDFRIDESLEFGAEILDKIKHNASTQPLE